MENSVTAPPATETTQEPKSQTKELNFERLRKENERLAQHAEAERQARLKIESEIAAWRQHYEASRNEEEDESDEPYIDRKTFKKQLSRLEKQLEEKIDKKAEEKARTLLEEAQKKDFAYKLKSEYRDFDEVLNSETAEKFSQQHPELAQEVLSIPDEYQRRKMAYQMIKSIGLHKKEDAVKASAQAKIDANLRNPYFHAGAIANGSQLPIGDFSEAGQKAAYEKMKALMRNPLGSR